MYIIKIKKYTGTRVKTRFFKIIIPDKFPKKSFRTESTRDYQSMGKKKEEEEEESEKNIKNALDYSKIIVIYIIYICTAILSARRFLFLYLTNLLIVILLTVNETKVF